MINESSREASDRLVVRGLELRCVIGVEDWERSMPQRVLVDIEVTGDFSTAAESDDLEDAVDYREVCALATEVAGDGEYRLLETLADRVAREVLGMNGCVVEVTVSVFKPLASAVIGGAGARVEVRRLANR